MPTFAGLITIAPKRSIGAFTAQVTMEEVHQDDLQITEHPVETGASITDHAFKRPAQVTIRCGWTNSSMTSLIGAAQGLLSAITGGSAVGKDYVSGIYEQLLALQASRVLFDIVTGKRDYQNMLIQSLAVTTDVATENALMVTMTCREVIIVKTQSTTLPDVSQQATPWKTAGTVDMGTKSAIPATPSPGGSVPIQ
ncbi:phage baseplate protein [Uliginosibacterium sp. sgz301328]|uniref:phage baseplate protein n=1 Tax=Uliginosibacterium sp. sgz301328 TaxID=3243764 RepID=UPI00359D18C1